MLALARDFRMLPRKINRILREEFQFALKVDQQFLVQRFALERSNSSVSSIAPPNITGS